LETSEGYDEEGLASWYGEQFHGRPTSSQEPFDMFAMTAAHKSLPIPSYVQVENLDNGRVAVVRVNDRGPFHEGRIIDLSYAAALKLGVVGPGTARVRVRAVGPVQSRR
jgi:rare lipoprotein A